MSHDDDMYLIKRDGRRQLVSFDKLLRRVKAIGEEVYDIPVPELQKCLPLNYTDLVMKIIDQLYNDIQTSSIDSLLADQCASMGTIHPDYKTLA